MPRNAINIHKETFSSDFSCSFAVDKVMIKETYYYYSVLTDSKSVLAFVPRTVT